MYPITIKIYKKLILQAQFYVKNSELVKSGERDISGN